MQFLSPCANAVSFGIGCYRRTYELFGRCEKWTAKSAREKKYIESNGARRCPDVRVVRDMPKTEAAISSVKPVR